jgi:hypothetical protein
LYGVLVRARRGPGSQNRRFPARAESESLIACGAPLHTAGLHEVRVSVPGVGRASFQEPRRGVLEYAGVIDGIEPAAGSAYGGHAVSVFGAGFPSGTGPWGVEGGVAAELTGADYGHINITTTRHLGCPAAALTAGATAASCHLHGDLQTVSLRHRHPDLRVVNHALYGTPGADVSCWDVDNATDIPENTEASKVCDGDLGSHWFSAMPSTGGVPRPHDAPRVVQFAFSEPAVLTSYQIFTASHASLCPQYWVVYGSNDRAQPQAVISNVTRHQCTGGNNEPLSMCDYACHARCHTVYGSAGHINCRAENEEDAVGPCSQGACAEASCETVDGEYTCGFTRSEPRAWGGVTYHLDAPGVYEFVRFEFGPPRQPCAGVQVHEVLWNARGRSSAVVPARTGEAGSGRRRAEASGSAAVAGSREHREDTPSDSAADAMQFHRGRRRMQGEGDAGADGAPQLCAELDVNTCCRPLTDVGFPSFRFDLSGSCTDMHAGSSCSVSCGERAWKKPASNKWADYLSEELHRKENFTFTCPEGNLREQNNFPGLGPACVENEHKNFPWAASGSNAADLAACAAVVELQDVAACAAIATAVTNHDDGAQNQACTYVSDVSTPEELLDMKNNECTLCNQPGCEPAPRGTRFVKVRHTPGYSKHLQIGEVEVFVDGYMPEDESALDKAGTCAQTNAVACADATTPGCRSDGGADFEDACAGHTTFAACLAVDADIGCIASECVHDCTFTDHNVASLYAYQRRTGVGYTDDMVTIQGWMWKSYNFNPNNHHHMHWRGGDVAQRKKIRDGRLNRGNNDADYCLSLWEGDPNHVSVTLDLGGYFNVSAVRVWSCDSCGGANGALGAWNQPNYAKHFGQTLLDHLTVELYEDKAVTEDVVSVSGALLASRSSLSEVPQRSHAFFNFLDQPTPPVAYSKVGCYMDNWWDQPRDLAVTTSPTSPTSRADTVSTLVLDHLLGFPRASKVDHMNRFGSFEDSLDKPFTNACALRCHGFAFFAIDWEHKCSCDNDYGAYGTSHCGHSWIYSLEDGAICSGDDDGSAVRACVAPAGADNDTVAAVAAVAGLGDGAETPLAARCKLAGGHYVNTTPLVPCALNAAESGCAVAGGNCWYRPAIVAPPAEHQYHQTRGSTPLVDSISPASGVGGTSITIRGQRLSTTTAVLFDGLPATILSVPNDQTVHVIAPEHPGGTYPVVVQTGLGRAGRVVGAPTFEYTLLVDAVRQQDRVVPIWP